MSPIVNHRSLPARAGLLFCLVLACSAATAADEEDLHRLLDEFLANADRVEMHEAFWADELVYTSSDGTRTNKQAIVASMQGVASKRRRRGRLTAQPTSTSASTVTQRSWRSGWWPGDRPLAS